MSPRLLGRIAGLLYLLEGLTSTFGQLIVPGMFVVTGDAHATAAKIVDQESLFRLGLASAWLAVAFHTALTVVFFVLFRHVHRTVALFMAAIAVVAIALQATSTFFQGAPLVLLAGGQDLSALGKEQLDALALLFMKLRGQAFNIYLVFFGFRCVALGYLISRSIFMPRLIGVLMMLAGVGYLTLLWPPLANAVAPFNLAIAAPGELSILLWLLLFGVNADRWREQARAAVIAEP